MPDCFIIMPITTPQHLLELYDNDANHFEHILSYLFIPAIKQAGYNPILPTRKGSENIQAEIIKNLEIADMVFCDISCYNPNVYFELGCRTALNKPVCYVKDDLTSSIPFDTGTITHHTYKSKLHPWVIEKEIPTLKNHFMESVQSSKGENSLWKYFGLRNVAKPYLSNGNDDSKIDLIIIPAIKCYPFHAA